MANDTTIGIIGLGHMGSALIRGWSGQEGLRLLGYDADQQQMDKFGETEDPQKKESLQEMAEESEYLVLAVKPQQMLLLLQDLSPFLRGKHCLISVAAGKRMESLDQYSGGICPVVRVMPNMPALVDAGCFALCLQDPRLSQEQYHFVQKVFHGLGRVYILQEEHFDAFTALMGSGPAYVYYFMESLIEAGVSMGFPREQSREMVQALMEGSVKMSELSKDSVTSLRESIMSPAGTTGAGVLELERKAVRSSIVDAVLAAKQRSSELGG